MYGEKYTIIRSNLAKLDGVYRRNFLPINNNESKRHLTQKFNVCCMLKDLGYDFICEARFRNHLGRSDIFIPYLDICIEIIDSEKELKQSKKDNYPVKKIVSIQSNEEIKDLGKLL